jgi:predicted transcriptional regulator
MKNNEMKAVDILMSPCKTYVLNSLFDESEGLSASAIRSHMDENLPEMSGHLQVHLNELIKDRILESREGGYALSGKGKEVYEEMQKLLERVEIPC